MCVLVSEGRKTTKCVSNVLLLCEVGGAQNHARVRAQKVRLVTTAAHHNILFNLGRGPELPPYSRTLGSFLEQPFHSENEVCPTYIHE